MKASPQTGLRDTAKFEVSRAPTNCRASHDRFVVDAAGAVKRLAADAAKAGLA